MSHIWPGLDVVNFSYPARVLVALLSQSQQGARLVGLAVVKVPRPLANLRALLTQYGILSCSSWGRP